MPGVVYDYDEDLHTAIQAVIATSKALRERAAAARQAAQEARERAAATLARSKSVKQP